MGVDYFETKVMFFQRKSEFVDDVPFINIYNERDYIKASIGDLRAVKSTLKAKTLSEIKSDDSDFSYRVKKYLYEFKTHKNLQYYSSKAEALIEKFNTQNKPEGMEYKEWDNIKLTEAKVLATFKRVMKNAYIVDRDVIRVVKQNHTFKIKPYSGKMKHVISKKVSNPHMNISQLVAYRGEFEKFLTACKVLNLDTTELTKVVNRKYKDYLLHNASIKDIQPSKEIKRFVNSFKFISKGKVCKLTKIQKEDIGKVLTRKHTLLGWSMGGGKSVALLCMIKYINKHKLSKNVFVTAPAIALDLTLKNFLSHNGVDFIEIKNANQLKNIKDGKVVLMTLGRLSMSKDSVKEFVKSKSNKVSILFDEVDEIKNRLSKRSRAVINAFRRCHRTFCFTGTPTRNNINEIYAILELMYNNSHNMMCEVSSIYTQDKKSKEIKNKPNNKKQLPFDAYYGFGLFKSCFSPSKTTVFGIKKDTQNIFNTDELKRIVERTVIIRSSEELMGDKKIIKSHFVQPNLAERELQETIMKEFHQICYTYFRSTGNSRKESYLRIIRMINLLIKSCTAPHLMNDWNGQGLPTKYSKVLKMIGERPNEPIMIGCVGIPSTQSYYDEIKNKYPNRRVYYVDGTIPFKKRKQIVDEFNNSDNAILVSNQASLKSSVSIEKCNTVIIPSLPWNYASLSQYFYRAIRFDSEHKTEVHLITYTDSIDLNVLQLLLNKEKINNFIKTGDESTDEEVNEEFGVDGDVLGSVIEKYYDEEGGMRFMLGSESKRVS
ncbi:helicase [Tenacibaculum phage PTm5]|nr:helicase [Tenacibaculum phage PTm5]